MLTDTQRSLVDSYLAPRIGDGLGQPRHTLALTKRQLAFLLDAVEHYHRDCCPLRGGTEGCRLRTWYESPATGAIELLCADSCLDWRDALIAQSVPEAVQAVAEIPPGPRFIPAD